MAPSLLSGLGRWLDVLGCPYCQQALRLQDGMELACVACGATFSVEGRVPDLLRQEDRARFAVLSHKYRNARLADGWTPLTSELALQLPFRSPSGYPLLYWEVRRQSYRRLMRRLAQEGPPPEAGPVADLGAGIGWLGFRLAQEGYRVLAVDASRDDYFGLGAGQSYLDASPGCLLLAQGDLEHPPLCQGKWSFAILNASLHYARDLDGTLCRAAHALRPGGEVIILDTPIACHPTTGTGCGDRHLGHGELHNALEQAGLRPRWAYVWRGPRWWTHQLKTLLCGRAFFSFPMIVAQKQ